MLLGDITSFRSIQGQLTGLARMERICAAWDLTGEIKLGDQARSAQALIINRMKSLIAARFVWQRLDGPARRFLYELLCTKNLGKGVPVARIQRQLKFNNEEVEAAVRQLTEMFLLEEDMLLSQQSARFREQGLLEPVPARALFLYRECAESLWDTGQELFLAYDNRERQSLPQLLRTMRRGHLEHLARLCHVTAHSVIPMYSSYPEPSFHPQEIHQNIVDALRQVPILKQVFSRSVHFRGRRHKEHIYIDLFSKKYEIY